MKTFPLTVALLGATLLAAPALAQTTGARAPQPAAGGAAAATLPEAFEAEAPGPAAGPATGSTGRVGAAAPAAQAPDIARSEQALRAAIAAFQAARIDYTVFSPDLAEQIRAQSGVVAPLIQQFGALKTIEHRGQQDGADLFRVVFDKQATDWVIGFNGEDQIAALLFRPAQD